MGVSQPFYCYFQALGLPSRHSSNAHFTVKTRVVIRSQKSRQRGVLITFEGIEGSGKTTQCAQLAKLLREKGYRVVETREPGGTPLAEAIRAIILSSSSEPMAPRCEALLILASRSQHAALVIQPALAAGAVVLCDRFSDSTLAYQGAARGLDQRDLRVLDRFATKGVTPALTLLFDVTVSKGLARRGRHGKALDRLDQETRRFHERVRKGYLDLAARHPGRIKVIDAGSGPETVQARVASIVLPFLDRHRNSASAHNRKRKTVKGRTS